MSGLNNPTDYTENGVSRDKLSQYLERCAVGWFTYVY